MDKAKKLSITLAIIIAVFLVGLCGLLFTSTTDKTTVAADTGVAAQTATPVSLAYDDSAHVDILVDAFRNSPTANALLPEIMAELPQYDFLHMLSGEGSFVIVTYDGYLYLRYGTGFTGWSDYSKVDIFTLAKDNTVTYQSVITSSSIEWYTGEEAIADTAVLMIVGLKDGLTYANAYLDMDGYKTEMPTMEEFLTQPEPPEEPGTLPPEPVKDGHTFTGWYFDEACTLPYDGSPIYSDTTLYAGFSVNSYSVTVDGVSSTVPYGTVLDLDPLRDGYTLTGWDVGGAVHPVGTTFTVTGDLTLTALWQKDFFTLSLDETGGESIPDLEIAFNSTPDVPTPTRVGHTFLGWFIGGTEYVPAPMTGNLLLTAKWQINRYTVTFVVDGAEYRTLEVDYGTALTDLLEQNGIAGYSLLDTQGEIVGADAIVDGNGAFTAIQETVEKGTNTVLQFFKDVWAHIKANYIAISLSVIGAVVLMIIGAVFTKKRRG